MVGLTASCVVALAACELEESSGDDVEVVVEESSRGFLSEPSTTMRVVTLPPEEPARPATDPKFDTCGDAKDAGYGPYTRADPEYSWYDDRDDDGIVCE